MRKISILLILLLILPACRGNKEDALKIREDNLKMREEQVLANEAEYRALLKMRDSLQAVKADTTDIIAKVTRWPDSINLSWNAKTICKESDCSNYVIGDQRNQQWEFTSDSVALYANVLNKDKLVRVLAAAYHEKQIVLNFATDSVSKNKLSIKVVLDDIKKDVIKGTQTITGQDNCKAKFSVELTPSKK